MAASDMVPGIGGAPMGMPPLSIDDIQQDDTPAVPSAMVMSPVNGGINLAQKGLMEYGFRLVQPNVTTGGAGSRAGSMHDNTLVIDCSAIRKFDDTEVVALVVEGTGPGADGSVTVAQAHRTYCSW